MDAMTGRETAPAGPPSQDPDAGITAEGRAIRDRYARRADPAVSDRYDPLRLDVLTTIHQRERALRRWVLGAGLGHPRDISVMEVGCGAGGWLESFLRLGFRPEHLTGVDLLPDDIAAARHRLPSDVRLEVMDAAALTADGQQYDVCTQATALSSILDAETRRAVAATMWQLTRPGGGVLSFDFAYSNPSNPDVIGMPVRELRSLFPESATPRVWRLVLAPPIGRRAARWGQLPYDALQALAPLRTHRLVWFPKPGEPTS